VSRFKVKDIRLDQTPWSQLQERSSNEECPQTTISRTATKQKEGQTGALLTDQQTDRPSALVATAFRQSTKVRTKEAINTTGMATTRKMSTMDAVPTVVIYL
jgi:hypothetical protein